jgi:hypothetical protein
MVGKRRDFLADFAERGDVTAWISFPMDAAFGDADRAYLSKYRVDTDPPPVGIFGPIFCASHRAVQRVLARNLWPPPARNRSELCASERAFAFAFHRAGFVVNWLEAYSNERLDQVRDYAYFDKFRPNRE